MRRGCRERVGRAKRGEEKVGEGGGHLDVLGVDFDVVVACPIEPQRLTRPRTPLLNQLTVGKVHHLEGGGGKN